MHGKSRGAHHLAPGLTPLTGQYRRPGTTWACYRRDVPQLSFLSDRDETGEFVYCRPVSDVVNIARLAYYAAKLFQALRGAPIPPP